MADLARVLLACVRLFNGLAALVAPGMLLGRLGVDTEANPAAAYIARMFGIRTVLIGWELLAAHGEARQKALRQAVLIHASDTLAAYLAAQTGKLPPPMNRVLVAISAMNTVLALIANH